MGTIAACGSDKPVRTWPSLYRRLTILNSELMEFYYARISNQIRGGYRRSFTQYIQGLPIVSPTKDLGNKVAKVLKLAKSEGSASPVVREIEADINEIVFGLYGLTRDEIRLVKEDLAASQPTYSVCLPESEI